jgi:hypothetical protein
MSVLPERAAYTSARLYIYLCALIFLLFTAIKLQNMIAGIARFSRRFRPWTYQNQQRAAICNKQWRAAFRRMLNGRKQRHR